MSDDLWFAIAVVLLLVCLAAGWRRWGERDLGPTGAGWLAKFVLISTAVGGVLGAPFWWLTCRRALRGTCRRWHRACWRRPRSRLGVTGLIVLERPARVSDAALFDADSRISGAPGAGGRRIASGPAEFCRAGDLRLLCRGHCAFGGLARAAQPPERTCRL